jgi:hypothetical protein
MILQHKVGFNKKKYMPSGMEKLLSWADYSIKPVIFKFLSVCVKEAGGL